MQATNNSEDRLCKFEELLSEIDPSYQNAGYAYFVTLKMGTCEQDLVDIIDETVNLKLEDFLEVCTPKECYLGIKPTYSLEIRITK